MHLPKHPLSPPIFPARWAADWGEDHYGLWQTLRYKTIEYTFRWIQPGEFLMGSPVEEKGRYDDEDLHTVILTEGFWIGETTVTQALWQAIMYKNLSHFIEAIDDNDLGKQRPVEQVSWDDCQNFIKAFNQLHSDLNVCLPWEAQWEYACRAGIQTPFNFEAELTLDRVNYRGIWEYSVDKWGDAAKQTTVNVKSYSCNDWGLHEMHGNVWEWCQDVWQDNLGKVEVTDPWKEGKQVDAVRVLRGGSWLSDGRNVRSACRLRYSSDVRLNDIGFRLSLGH